MIASFESFAHASPFGSMHTTYINHINHNNHNCNQPFSCWGSGSAVFRVLSSSPSWQMNLLLEKRPAKKKQRSTGRSQTGRITSWSPIVGKSSRLIDITSTAHAKVTTGAQRRTPTPRQVQSDPSGRRMMLPLGCGCT